MDDPLLTVFRQLPAAEKARALATVASAAPSLNGHGAPYDGAPYDGAPHGDVAPLTPTPVADLLRRDFPPLIWLVDGMLAKGHLIVLGGRPKSGKSWLALQLAQAVDTGAAFLGRDVCPGRVCYVALEDGERRVYQRCHLLRWRPKHAGVLFQVARFDGDGQPGPGVQQIAHLAAGHDLLIIDTLIKTLSGRANENDNVQMGAIANELAAIAHTSDCALLLVHHTGKGLVENVFDSLRGASAIRGAYDVGMLLERKQNEREAVLHMESRDVDLAALTIRQAENGAGWDALGDGSELAKIRVGREIVEALLETGDGQTADELAAATGRSVSAINRQLNTAETRGLVRFEKAQRDGSKKPVKVWSLT